MATDMQETMAKTTNNYDGINDDTVNDDTVNDDTEMHIFSRLTAEEKVACNFCSRRLTIAARSHSVPATTGVEP